MYNDSYYEKRKEVLAVINKKTSDKYSEMLIEEACQIRDKNVNRLRKAHESILMIHFTNKHLAFALISKDQIIDVGLYSFEKYTDITKRARAISNKIYKLIINAKRDLNIDIEKVFNIDKYYDTKYRISKEFKDFYQVLSVIKDKLFDLNLSIATIKRSWIASFTDGSSINLQTTERRMMFYLYDRYAINYEQLINDIILEKKKLMATCIEMPSLLYVLCGFDFYVSVYYYNETPSPLSPEND